MRLIFALIVMISVLGIGLILPSAWASLLWELEIKGNTAVSTDLIEEAIASTASSHFPLLGPKREFDPVVLQADQKRIERLYRRLGFYQAKAEEAQVKPCGESRVCVTLHISEGKPTTIGAVTIRVGQASPRIEEAQLLPIFGMKAGDRFEHDRYLAAKKTVESHLREKAYPLPAVKGVAIHDPERNTVAVSLEALPGTAARIGLIRFEGLELILPEDAMSRLPIKTGDSYDPRAFEDARDLLASLDVFGTIEPVLKPRPTEPAIVDVVFKVREKPLKTLQFGAGIRVENSRQEARARAEWIDRNFHRHLRRFDVRAEPRYAVLPSVFRPEQAGPLGNAEVSMLHPAFMGARQDLRTSIGFDSDLEQGYRWYGPRVSGDIGHRVSRRVSVGGGYSFRYLSFYGVELSATPSSRLVPSELLFDKSYRLGFLDQRILWDGRDDAIEPHQGAYGELRTAEAAQFLASAFPYLKLQPELRYYVPMTRRATLASRVSYGRIYPLQGRPSPITERFYGGGANGNRGFAYHRLSPQVTTVDGRLVPVGGDAAFEFSLEERIRLVRLGSSWLIGALFLDGGDVVEAIKDLDFKRLHYAAGPGLRYDTPLGVIRADLGIRLNRLGPTTAGRANPDPDSRFAVHLGLGEAF